MGGVDGSAVTADQQEPLVTQRHPSSSGEPITIQRVHTQQLGRLRLASPAISYVGRIHDVYSGYYDNISPVLEWTGMPDAETFAIVMEDPDAPTEKPVLHWAIWNIPGTLEALPGALRRAPKLGELGGAVQGRNHNGEFGYMGPKPPRDDPPHHYHFQLFALDLRLTLPPDTPLEELVHVLKAHAIADAELIGLYQAPATQ
jgi:Raf kinase inhibitor-like YbhB/YbcL family protein